MRQVNVVTAFIESRGRFLVLRRSAKVSSYPQHWSGVSGTCDDDPAAQAWREIHEEIKLSPDELELLHVGPPLPVTDHELDTVWQVHPILFHLKREAQIRLNWENDQFTWLTPAEFAAYQTVPKLSEVLQQVYPPPYPGTEIENELHEIETDLVSGSAQIAQKAISILKRAAVYYRSQDVHSWLTHIDHLAHRLIASRPSMAAISSQAMRFLEVLHQQPADEVDLVELRERCFLIEDEISQRRDAAIRDIGSALKLTLDPCSAVLIHSYSSTVIAALTFTKPPLERVIVTESRPGLEGRRAAQLLANVGYRVELITDGSAAHFMAEVDCVVVGSDTICSDGSVVNKMGTRGLAILAHHERKPFYVVSDSSKVQQLHLESYPTLEKMDPDEIFIDPPPGVTPQNVYFDITDGKLISGYVTEMGCLAWPELRRIGAERRKILATTLPALFASAESSSLNG